MPKKKRALTGWRYGHALNILSIEDRQKCAYHKGRVSFNSDPDHTLVSTHLSVCTRKRKRNKNQPLKTQRSKPVWRGAANPYLFNANDLLLSRKYPR